MTPIVDLFAAQSGKVGKNYRVLGLIPNQVACHSNPLDAPKRKRGRPKLTDRTRIIHILEKSPAYVNYDTSHRDLNDYQYVNNNIFTDPNTGRSYQIAVICYVKTTKEPMAYRRNFGDLSGDPFDDFPFRVKRGIRYRNTRSQIRGQ